VTQTYCNKKQGYIKELSPSNDLGLTVQYKFFHILLCTHIIQIEINEVADNLLFLIYRILPNNAVYMYKEFAFTVKF
jgi:hypothetical protein